MTEKVLFVDTETGGLDPLRNSLFSIGLVVWCNGNIHDSLEVFIYEPELEIDTSALEINNISLDFLRTKANTPRNAFEKIAFFLADNFGKQKITLAGHNVAFDVNFLKMFYHRLNENFSNTFSHRYIDTASILHFLYLSNVITRKAISSNDAFELFDININSRHSALGDAMGTAVLFNKLIKLMHEKMIR